MRGITEERLRELLRTKPIPNSWSEVIAECHELNPWLPIADAPKDRPILLRVSGFAIEGIAEYGMSNSWLTLVTKQQVRPTHYQELPEYPK